ncbi:MAG TPA: hypothetical protein VE439_00465, partial [Anaerolineae bacterium]|nr:hypothetical protein [Anaerolineae bacterium]
MNKPIKIILGIATLWPILYFFLFFAFVFSQIFFIFSGVDQSGEPSSFFFVIFALHALTIFWIIGLLVIYIVNV